VNPIVCPEKYKRTILSSYNSDTFRSKEYIYMSTMTAQILIGSSHRYQGGINPSHHLFFSENDNPAWVLFSERDFSSKTRRKQVIWTPTLENTLEDAFLMIAIHVINEKEVTALANSFRAISLEGRVELYEHFTESQRNKLYEQCRLITSFPKLIISIFSNSWLQNKLNVIEKYNVEVEVCCPIFSRTWASFKNECCEKGSLVDPKSSE